MPAWPVARTGKQATNDTSNLRERTRCVAEIRQSTAGEAYATLIEFASPRRGIIYNSVRIGGVTWSKAIKTHTMENPMDARVRLSRSCDSPYRMLADRLMQLAEEADGAGLRPEAVLLVAMAYSLFQS
jgi:hypothetical protein